MDISTNWPALHELGADDVVDIQAAGTGGNNRIYRLLMGNGNILALKVYPGGADDRDRLEAEFGALRFLTDGGVDCVPIPVAKNAEAGIALYSWIDGQPIESPTAADMDKVIIFIGRLHAISAATSVAALHPAREACWSAAELIRQVEKRTARLAEVAPDHAELADFLDTRLRPAIKHERRAVFDGYDRMGWDPNSVLPHNRLVLSPSDFGFHNALRRRDGDLVFLDFEYFGWDDPVRLVADFVLHPGMRLELEQRNAFVRHASRIFADDVDFKIRLRILYPFVALRWCAILLNEYLPDRWLRRSRAGEARSRGDALSRQMAKARHCIGRTQELAELIHDDR